MKTLGKIPQEMLILRADCINRQRHSNHHLSKHHFTWLVGQQWLQSRFWLHWSGDSWAGSHSLKLHKRPYNNAVQCFWWILAAGGARLGRGCLVCQHSSVGIFLFVFVCVLCLHVIALTAAIRLEATNRKTHLVPCNWGRPWPSELPLRDCLDKGHYSRWMSTYYGHSNAPVKYAMKEKKKRCMFHCLF